MRLSPAVRPRPLAVGRAARALTPARALAVVAIAAVVALGGAQFADYRAVEIGAPQYSGVQADAPAPEIDRRTARSAHGDWVLAIAAGAALVIALALARNWRLARLLIFLGAGVIGISLAIDAPRGLHEGVAGISYEGAKAILLGGFWVQLLSGVTLVVVGPTLAVQLRADRDARRSRSRGPAGVPGASSRDPQAEAGAT
jgi:hypothetical protein